MWFNSTFVAGVSRGDTAGPITLKVRGMECASLGAP